MITFEMGYKEDFPFIANEYDQFTIQTDKGPKYYQIIGVENFQSERVYDHGITEYSLSSVKISANEIKFLTVKTKEEKLAEETVKAAKEALNKAEKTLKAVRDSK